MALERVADLGVEVGGGLRLPNGVLVASGTFGWGYEYRRVMDVDRLGAVVSKGTTPEPRQGNPPPRLAETPSGLLNSIGLQNPGVDYVASTYAPLWAGWRVPVIVNIAAEAVEDYARLAGRLEAVPGVAGLELNISCPNIAQGRALFGNDPRTAAAATAAARGATRLPLMVKLTPNVPDIGAVARAVVDAGADSISVMNTLGGFVPDRAGTEAFLGGGTGGLSGPAIRPLALRLVREVAAVVRVPVLGIGGISTWAHARQFLAAGAVAVQVGTANFSNPRAALEVLDGLEQEVTASGARSYEDWLARLRPAPGGAR